MSHRWKYGNEYHALKKSFREAEQLGDEQRCNALRPRITELDAMLWQATISGLPELSPYMSVIDAIQATSQHLHLTIPSLDDPGYEHNDGHFALVIGHTYRTIQIWPRGSQGYYAVDVFAYDDQGTEYCYLGHTPSLAEATKVLSYWLSLDWPIAAVHAACPWLPCEPFHFTGSRISFE